MGLIRTPGLFARCVGTGRPRARVTRSLRGERPERFTWDGSGFARAGVSFRAALRMIRTSWLSRACRRAVAHSTGRPTRKWSRRARRSCAILSPRRAAHLQRWTDRRNEEPGSLESTKNKSQLAASSIGVTCGTSGSDSHEPGLPIGGAAVIGPFGRRGQFVARAVGEGHVRNRARGYFDLDDASSAVGLLRTAARQRRNPRAGRAPLARSGC